MVLDFLLKGVANPSSFSFFRHFSSVHSPFGRLLQGRQETTPTEVNIDEIKP
jgi:hypothetical protein